MSDWQPIETHPKHSDLVWLTDGKQIEIGLYCKTTHWDWHFVDGFHDEEPRFIHNAWVRRTGGPTHWMPITYPAPPAPAP